VIEALEASRRPAAAVVTPRVTTAPRLPPPPVLAPSPPPAAVPPPRVAAIARAPAPAPGPPPAAVVPAPAAPVAPPPQRRVLPVPDVPHRAGAPARVVIRRARWRAIVGLVVLLLVPLLGVAIGIMLWSVLGGRPESPQMREDGSPEDRR